MKLKGYDVLLLVLAVVTASAVWLAARQRWTHLSGCGLGEGWHSPARGYDADEPG